VRIEGAPQQRTGHSRTIDETRLRWPHEGGRHGIVSASDRAQSHPRRRCGAVRCGAVQELMCRQHSGKRRRPIANEILPRELEHVDGDTCPLRLKSVID
jgi:hypothetical protein